MADIIFRLTEPEELTADLLSYLQATDKFDSSETTTLDVLRMVKEGQAQLFVYWNGKAKGVVVTCIQNFGVLRELFVWRIGGTGLIDDFPQLEALLVRFAKDNEVERIRTFSQNHVHEKMLNLMLNAGYKPTSLEMIKEI